MRRHRKAYWIVFRALLSLFAVLPADGGVRAAAPDAAPLNRIESVDGANGRIIHFTDLDVVLSDAAMPPTSGWRRIAAEPVWTPEDLHSRPGVVHAIWARMRFDRGAVDADPLALFTQDNREQITVFVNSKELFRNFSNPADNVQGWYRPYLIPVPVRDLHPGINEIMFRVDSNYKLGVGEIWLGPNVDLQQRFARQMFWRINAPFAANFAMLILAATALLLWIARRNEYELLFLALSGFLWFARNYHYFAPRVQVEPQLFSNLTLYALYFATVASLGFCLIFLGIPRRRPILWAMCGLGLLLSAAHCLGLIGVIPIYFATFGVALLVCAWVLAGVRRSRLAEHWVLFFIIATLTLSSAHDIGRIIDLHEWDGLGFYIQPFIGLIFCIAFLISFGKRSLHAFSELEDLNRNLEGRVVEARAELAQSEAKRRELEVARALESERERLMREMHDGIGSNLVAALAVAEQQGQPPTTIDTLRRALADLKITVDSLEPVNGDVVALIANLRHRMERDLRRAGLTCRWKVKPCERLDWLDANSALHVLRIFQEAIGNVLLHSQAKEMEIGCHPDARAGRDGVATYVFDNGVGWTAPDGSTSGKGLVGMRRRAESLQGILEVEARGSRGTKVSLWLPYCQ